MTVARNDWSQNRLKNFALVDGILHSKYLCIYLLGLVNFNLSSYYFIVSGVLSVIFFMAPFGSTTT